MYYFWLAHVKVCASDKLSVHAVTQHASPQWHIWRNLIPRSPAPLSAQPVGFGVVVGGHKGAHLPLPRRARPAAAAVRENRWRRALHPFSTARGFLPLLRSVSLHFFCFCTTILSFWTSSLLFKKLRTLCLLEVWCIYLFYLRSGWFWGGLSCHGALSFINPLNDCNTHSLGIRGGGLCIIYRGCSTTLKIIYVQLCTHKSLAYRSKETIDLYKYCLFLSFWRFISSTCKNLYPWCVRKIYFRIWKALIFIGYCWVWKI